MGAGKCLMLANVKIVGEGEKYFGSIVLFPSVELGLVYLIYLFIYFYPRQQATPSLKLTAGKD